MGSLTSFNIKEIKEKYELSSFVETGTWKGDSVEYAYQAGFSPIVSIELKQDFWESAVARFKNRSPDISILLGSSQERLPDTNFMRTYYLKIASAKLSTIFFNFFT